MDLGANRGAFSTLMAANADFVISVEAQSEFLPVIHHNMQVNKFSNYAVENGFVGSGGILDNNQNYLSLTIEALMDKYNIEKVDLVKLDIEGSEFPLFTSPSWLRKIRALSMEIHLDYGNPNIVLESLRKYNFDIVMADENLRLVTDTTALCFIYAWKNDEL